MNYNPALNDCVPRRTFMKGYESNTNNYMNVGALSPYYPDKFGHGDYGPIQLANTEYYTVNNRSYPYLPYPPNTYGMCNGPYTQRTINWPISVMRPDTRPC